METFQILSDQFNHFQHLFHRWLAIFFIISSYIFDLSSSPHTWGIRRFWATASVGRRFIPTYVGHTSGSDVEVAVLSGSSPHTWGIRLSTATNAASCGSSPHTWGIQTFNTNPAGMNRFIPTYVGHTKDFESSMAITSVHPHIRGAYNLGPGGPGQDSGSSPHTWGILDERLTHPCRPRFIPTYVGHTLDRRKKNGWFQPLLL